MSISAKTEIIVRRYYKDKRSSKLVTLPEDNSSGFYGNIQLRFEAGVLVGVNSMTESLPSIEVIDADL